MAMNEEQQKALYERLQTNLLPAAAQAATLVVTIYRELQDAAPDSSNEALATLTQAAVIAMLPDVL